MAYRYVQLYDKNNNPTYTVKGPNAAITTANDSTGYWYKFATVTTTGNYQDINLIFQVNRAYSTYGYGILCFHVRRDTAVTMNGANLRWVCQTKGIRPKNYAYVTRDNAVDLYFYKSYAYEDVHFEVLKGDDRGGGNNQIGYTLTMFSYNNTTGSTSLPTGTATGRSYSDCYAIGDIICTTNSTDPSTYYGGTWEKITNRFLVGAGDTYSATGTGGGTVTLGVANIPAHTHTIAQHNHWWGATSGESGWHEHSCVTYNGATGGYEFVRPNGWSSQNTGRAIAGNGTHTHWSEGWTSTNGATATGSTGSTSAFSVVPAYYAVYFWRRTA